MGYYTYFKLTVTGETDIDVIGKFRDENRGAYYALGQSGNNERKWMWATHKEDVLEFSRKHPDILFLLEGEGEESGDVWKFYARNGRSYYQKAKIIFDEFDESMLVG